MADSEAPVSKQIPQNIEVPYPAYALLLRLSAGGTGHRVD